MPVPKGTSYGALIRVILLLGAYFGFFDFVFGEKNRRYFSTGSFQGCTAKNLANYVEISLNWRSFI
jgi:hypothetical protein